MSQFVKRKSVRSRSQSQQAASAAGISNYELYSLQDTAGISPRLWLLSRGFTCFCCWFPDLFFHSLPLCLSGSRISTRRSFIWVLSRYQTIRLVSLPISSVKSLNPVAFYEFQSPNPMGFPCFSIYRTIRLSLPSRFFGDRTRCPGASLAQMLRENPMKRSSTAEANDEKKVNYWGFFSKWFRLPP